MGDTLEIFGKEYTNVAGFKAKDGSGNTLTYTRGGGGGVDIPIFTLTWDSNFETILSVTCNKTYAQCKSIFESNETITVVAIALSDWGDALYQDSLALTGVMGGTDIRGDYLEYTCSVSGTPQYDIWFFEDGTITAVQPSNRVQTLNVTTNGTYTPEYGDYVWNEVVVNVSSGSPTLQSKTATPTESAQTITADSGYDGLSSVEVGAISNTYIGSGITRRTASDLYGIYDYGEYSVNVPRGYYDASYYKAVPNGTAGTPTATKGTVSNHSVTVTPSVTNTAGYITGGTKTGTAVTVSASELVSGTKTISENGTTDVTNYSIVDVNIPSNDFIVSISYDDEELQWIPNKTIGEIYNAYTEGKQIVAEINDPNAVVSGYYDSSHGNYIYSIYRNVSDSNGVYIERFEYIYSPLGAIYEDTYTKNYDPSSMTAIASEVAEGATFINSTGVSTGTAIRRSNTDLTVSGATVTVPAGLYSSQATKSVASGSAGTPTATKGTVSNHSITVTPSVTNTTGYITGGTKSGTGVTVSASELVSGSQTITANGTVDVTNLASVNVALTFSTIYTGTSTPSSSTGSNGDIYIKTS